MSEPKRYRAIRCDLANDRTLANESYVLFTDNGGSVCIREAPIDLIETNAYEALNEELQDATRKVEELEQSLAKVTAQHDYIFNKAELFMLENTKLKALLGEVVIVLEHALHLGHLGEGSTKGMAEKLLTKLQEASK